MKHKHAELMKQYAEDALKTDEPHKLWEYYIDGCEGSWEPCAKTPSWSSIRDYRRKPQEYQLTEADWQRVIDEGFYVRSKFASKHTLFKGNQIDNGNRQDLEVVREKGLRQPHFVGDKHPEGNTYVAVYFKDAARMEGNAWMLDWDDVIEYVVL